MRFIKEKSKGLLMTLLAASFLLVGFDAEAQRKNRKNKKEEAAQTAVKPAPKKLVPKKEGIQPFDKVITKDAKTDEGLFNIHKIDSKYFFEIPDAMLGRDMLMVTRIAKTASGIGLAVVKPIPKCYVGNAFKKKFY